MTAVNVTEPRGRRLAVVTAITGTVFIAAGAFWLSFTALADLARRSGIDRGQAWAWPLIVDGIIVVATVAVVALASQHRPTWYPWTLLAAGATVSVTANAIHAIIAADNDVPSLLAAAVAAIPPLVLLAITHLTVILTRPNIGTATETEAEAETKAEVAVEVEHSVNVPIEGAQHSQFAASFELEQGSEAEPEPQPVAPAAARTTHDRRGEAALLREEAGWSNKQIARHLGVHPSTVGRWFGTDAKEETS